MRDFDFVLPLNRDDLRRSSTVRQYVVEDVLCPRDTEAKIKEIALNKRNLGPDSIVECFDTLYSVLVHFSSLREDVIKDAWDIALTCACKVESELTLRLTHSENSFEAGWRGWSLNRLRMCCYALCQMTERTEAEYRKPSLDAVVSKGRGRKKTSPNGSRFLYWPSEKLKAVQCLLHLCELPLRRLWEMQVVEQEFVNLVTNCCFELTEDADILKATATKDTIIAVLGINVKRYSHGIACVLKITQLLQHHEHAAMLFAEAIEVFVEKYDLRPIVGEVIRELCHLDTYDSAPDSNGIRNTSLFLVELSSRLPHQLLNSISLLVTLLDVKSHTMRNGVLTALSRIVQMALCTDDLDQKLREVRDELLYRLECHILDENAFVRSKVLQVWQQLCAEKLIPLTQQRTLLQLVTERLLDKSSMVRKNALLFIGEFLRSNPFSAQISLEELQSRLLTEQEKLEDMTKDSPLSFDAPSAPCRTESAWEAMLPAVEEASAKDNDENEMGHIIEEEDIRETVAEFFEDIRRLLDSGAYRRALALTKAAMQKFPESNFFAPSSSEASLGDSVQCEDESPEKQISVLCVLKKIYLEGGQRDAAVEEPPAADCLTRSGPESGSDGVVNEISKQQILVQYLKDCVAFAEQIQAAIPIICKFLQSSTSSDIQEAVGFFVAAHQFGLRGALTGVRHMLPLIWSKEAALRDAVVNSYRTIYLTASSGSSRGKAVDVADKLSSLVEMATTSELLSLERLVAEFSKSGDISQKVIQVLWERFAMKLPDTTAAQSLAAIRLLGMIANTEPGIVKANLDILISCGLGTRAKYDLDLCRHTCCALEKLSIMTRPSETDPPNRLPESHDLVTNLKGILLDTFSCLDTNEWIPAMERGLDVIFKLVEDPIKIVNSILLELVAQTQTCQRDDAGGLKQAGSQDTAEGDNTSGQEADSDTINCPPVVLSRLLACVGYVALKQLIYLDVDVFTEMKRRRLAKELQLKGRGNRKSTRKSFSAIDHGTPKRKGDGNNEEEGELAGNAADDADAEYIIHLLDNEILAEDSTLGLLGSIAVHVVSNPSVFKEVQVQMNASMTLARLMLVSSVFCEEHLPLFFTILEKSPEPQVRANLVIAVGDLCLRFPNLIDPWTAKIYSRIGDSCREVRRSALSVLSFLILNDMIKVKGQISDLAVCLTDKDEDIAGITKEFFFDLGKKGNAIYNVLPDIISHLSDPEHGTDEESFRTILRFLFSIVDKERQLENFIEKLCLRFRTAETERQWRDLAFCLSLIPFSEKGLRKLQENLSCFADKLHVSEVYEGFATMLSNAKKCANIRIEFKTLIEELEEIIEELRTKRFSEEELVKRARSATQQPCETQNSAKISRTGHKTRMAGRPREDPKTPMPRRKITLADLGSSSEENSGSEERSPPPTPQTAPQRNTCAVAQTVSQSSSNSEQGCKSQTAGNGQGMTSTSKPTRKMVLASLGDSSNENSGSQEPPPMPQTAPRKNARAVAQAVSQSSSNSEQGRKSRTAGKGKGVTSTSKPTRKKVPASLGDSSDENSGPEELSLPQTPQTVPRRSCRTVAQAVCQSGGNSDKVSKSRTVGKGKEVTSTARSTRGTSLADIDDGSEENLGSEESLQPLPRRSKRGVAQAALDGSSDRSKDRVRSKAPDTTRKQRKQR